VDPRVSVSIEQLSFRSAVAADLQFLLELRRQTMVPHMVAAGVDVSDDELRVRVADQFGCAQIILVGPKPVGLLKVVREGRLWHLLQIQLLPELQRGGIGTALVRSVIAEAQQAGASLELDVLKVNPAKRLYERLGFRVVGEGAHAYDMRLDA
jgi:ribosomal protein S18 acetylase RimI-like enzyme